MRFYFCFAVLLNVSVMAQNRCGLTWSDANEKCDNTPCASTDAPCPTGQKCFADLKQCPEGPSPVSPSPVSPSPVSPSPVTPSPTLKCRPNLNNTKPVTPPPTDGGDCALTTYMGYYASWAATRVCHSMSPADIDPTPYTHLVFSFAKLSSSFELVPFFDTDVPLYKPFNALKAKKPGLKTILAVGGWTHNDPGTPTEKLFAQAAASEANRKTFAASCVTFLRQHGFDGLDIDWEYPADPSRGGTEADKVNLPLLLQEIKTAFQATEELFELSIAIPLIGWRLSMGYDLPAIQAHVDHINIMSYDLHGTWELTTSPFVNAHANLTEIDAALSRLDDLDSKKLNLGLAAYGRTATLASSTCNRPGCEFTAAGTKGACTQEPGILTYSEIIDLGVSPMFDTTTNEAAFGTYDNGLSWVGYDTPKTLQEKINVAKKRCYGGVLAWSIDQDSPTSPLLATIQLS